MVFACGITQNIVEEKNYINFLKKVLETVSCVFIKTSMNLFFQWNPFISWIFLL